MSHLRSFVKPQTIVTLPPFATIVEAAETMANKAISCLLVVEGEKISGIFTEHDLLTRVVAKKFDTNHTELASVMTKEVKTVTLDASLEDCFALFESTNCRHLPVLDAGKPIAIISARKGLGWALEALAYERDQLKQYITH